MCWGGREGGFVSAHTAIIRDRQLKAHAWLLLAYVSLSSVARWSKLADNKQTITNNNQQACYREDETSILTGISERLTLLRVLKPPSHHRGQALRVAFWFWAADPQDIMTTLGRAS